MDEQRGTGRTTKMLIDAQQHALSGGVSAVVMSRYEDICVARQLLGYAGVTEVHRSVRFTWIDDSGMDYKFRGHRNVRIFEDHYVDDTLRMMNEQAVLRYYDMLKRVRWSSR